jgi:cell division protein FtsN
MYYVTKASFLTKQDANVEEKNLDYTGFEASVLETDGTKKYHVVIAEFSDVQLAKQELAFAKEIDNSFYLMTVKPRK